MGNGPVRVQEQDAFEHEIYRADEPQIIETQPGVTLSTKPYKIEAHEEVEDESLSLSDKEKEMIRKAIERHKGKRKEAAKELGISERTLYRKINEYQIKG